MSAEYEMRLAPGLFGGRLAWNGARGIGTPSESIGDPSAPLTPACAEPASDRPVCTVRIRSARPDEVGNARGGLRFGP